MDLFLKLYLAHLIGDFILQFEELYRLKVRSLWGHFFHVSIHALISLALAFPFLSMPAVWIFIFTVSAIHYFQDIFKYTLQKKQPRYGFVLFVADQIMHALIVASVLFFPFARHTPSGPHLGGWTALYLEGAWTLFAIGFILVTFGGSYLLHSFRRNYVAGSRPDHFITSREMSYALIERPLVALPFIMPSVPFLWLCPVLVQIPRLFFPKLRNAADFILSFTYAACLGIIFGLLQ